MTAAGPDPGAADDIGQEPDVKYLKALFVLLFLGAGIYVFWGAGKSTTAILTAEQAQEINTLTRAYQDDRLDTVSREQVEAVAAAGGTAVPYLTQVIGVRRRERPDGPGKDDGPLIACLARIGSAGAVDGICTILLHDYSRERIDADRKLAAAALVLLGARDQAPLLARVIEDQEKLAAEEGPRSAAADTLAYLRRARTALLAGEGQGDPMGLCWITSPDGQTVRGFRDPLEDTESPPEKGPQKSP